MKSGNNSKIIEDENPSNNTPQAVQTKQKEQGQIAHPVNQELQSLKKANATLSNTIKAKETALQKSEELTSQLKKAL